MKVHIVFDKGYEYDTNLLVLFIPIITSLVIPIHSVMSMRDFTKIAYGVLTNAYREHLQFCSSFAPASCCAGASATSERWLQQSGSVL